MVTKRVIVPARSGAEGGPATVPGALQDLPPAASAADPSPADTPTLPSADAMPAPYVDSDAFEGAAPPSRRAAAAASAFWPLLLLALAWLGWMGFQLMVSMNDRNVLRDAHAQQQTTVDKSSQLRASLDALATDTHRLAEAGNPNARALVDELRRRGVTINPNAAQNPTPPK